jgi:hypothetical protein
VERVGWAVDDASELERKDLHVRHIAAHRGTGRRSASAAA